jgi:hypothetical protein
MSLFPAQESTLFFGKNAGALHRFGNATSLLFSGMYAKSISTDKRGKSRTTSLLPFPLLVQSIALMLPLVMR